jgi:hypothetical protein
VRSLSPIGKIAYALHKGKKMMLDETILENRLVTLEQAVSELQRKFESKPISENWLEKLIGSISDEVAFLEVLEYGRDFRQADKPTDECDEQP